MFNYVHYLKRLSDFDFVRKNIAVLLFFIVLAPYHNSFLPDTIRKANSDFTSYTNPNGAMEQNFNMTKSPETGYPPSELRMVAFKRAMAIIESRSGDFTTLQSQWTERGPVNVGGRTRALMFDPNDIDNKKVWAGGVAGGIWSIDDITDPLAEWSSADNFMANLAVTTMAYDPTNTSRFYAGTGEGWFNIDAVRGEGVFVSNDAGDTWSQLSSMADIFDYVQKIVVTPTGTILAAITSRTFNSNGIYQSTDQGATWDKVLSGRGADIEVGSDGSIVASLGIFSPGQIHRSVNDGKTWTAIAGVPPSAQRIELAIAPSNPSIIYATASNEGDITWLAKSENAGSSWTTFAIPTTIGQDCESSTETIGGNQAWYNQILAVHPTNPEKVIVGGISLYSSENGGQSWEQISYWTGFCLPYVHADQHAIQFRPGNPDEAIFGNDGGVFYSMDVGSTNTPGFGQRNNGYNVTQFYSLALENESQSNYMIAGTQDNGTQRFNSDGLNSTEEITDGDGGFCFIDSDLSLTQITSYIGNQYYLSQNGGGSFFLISEETDEGLFINPADYDDYLDILYAAGNPNQVNIYSGLASSPTKETFTFENIGQISHIKASENVIGRIFLGTENSGIFRIDNIQTDSPDIFNIRGDLPGTNYVSSIAIGESDDHLLITFSNYDVTHVYETTDGGVTWVAKEGDLPNIPVRWSLFNPADLKEVFLATEMGIWTTTDISLTNPAWVPDNLGLANVRTDMIKLRRADGLAGVATHGRGVFTTTMVSQSIADFTVGDPISYIDNEISFYDLSYNAGNSWGWEFDDGLTSGLSNTTHSYDEAGVYDISLTVGAGEDDKLVLAAVHILPDLNGTYLLSDGGDFESNADHFATLSVSGSSFERGNSAQTGKNGTVSGLNAWVLALNNTTHLSNTRAFLHTPSFNFINPGPYSLEFSTKYDIENGYDGFFVEYSIDRGSTWIKLDNNPDPVTWYNDIGAVDSRLFGGETMFSGNTGGAYVLKNTDLTFLAENTSVTFRFVFLSDESINEAGLAIDNFKVEGPTTAQFSADNDKICEGEFVVFTNESSGAITEYAWNFGADADPITAQGEGPHTVLYAVAGNKSVSLTINGTVTVDKTDFITVNPLPAIVTYTIAEPAICLGENAEIEFSNLEDGVNYSILDAVTLDEILSFQSDGSSNLLVTIENIEVDVTIVVQAVITTTNCMLMMTDELSITTKPSPPVTLVFNEGTLESSAGDSYEWMLDGVVIDGATDQTLVPSLKGIYTVIVSVNGCIGTSNEVDVTVVGINDMALSSTIKIYPNPTAQYLTIESAQTLDGTFELAVYAMDGKVVLRKEVKLDEYESLRLDIHDLKRGVYILKLYNINAHFEQVIFKTDN